MASVSGFFSGMRARGAWPGRLGTIEALILRMGFWRTVDVYFLRVL